MSESTPTNQSIETAPDRQRFSNGIINKIELNAGMDTLVVSILDAKISRGDFLIIPGDQVENPVLPEWGGRRAIAELELGGYDDGKSFPLPSQRLLVMKMDAGFKQELSPKIGADFGVTVGDEGFLLLAFGKDSLTGMAYVGPHTHNGIVGRQTNLTWLSQFGKNLYADSSKKWSPFGDNASISRIQLVVGRSTDNGNLTIQGQSENSRTHILTRASKRHQQILNGQKPENGVKHPAPAQKRRHLGRIARV